MTPWHLKFSDGREVGPCSEEQIRKGLADGTIETTSQIRQGGSAWIDADRVRDMFARLAKEGFYLKFVDGEVHGPYTQPRVRAMQVARELPSLFWIRHRDNGDWNQIESQPPPKRGTASGTASDATLPPQGSSNPTTAEIVAISIESVRVVTTQATVAEAEELAGADPLTELPATPATRALVESAPVMKLRRNDWQTRWTCLCDRVALALCGIQLKPDDEAKAA